MTLDYKKVAFQYGDKVIFVIFLVMFVVSALYSFKPFIPEEPRRYGNPTEKTEQILEEEEQVLKDLKTPPIPQLFVMGDPFGQWSKVHPGDDQTQCVNPQCMLIVPYGTETCPACKEPIPRPPEEDEDGDGIPDSWEQRFSEYADWQVADADRDDDKDRFTNKEEFMGSSHPGDPGSVPVPIIVTAINRKTVNIRFAGHAQYGRKRDNKFDLQIVWDNKPEMIKTGETFHGYKFDNPRWMSPGGTKRNKVLVVYVQKWDKENDRALGPKKMLIEGKYIPEDELSANFKIVQGPQTGKTFEGKYVEDELEVEDTTYIIQKIDLDVVEVKNQQSGAIIQLYPRTM